MIKQHKFFDGVILNLSGVMANTHYTNKCTWLERCEADKVRALWTFADDQPITHELLVERANEFVALAKTKGEFDAVWIRSLKSAPFFYTYVEDAFLMNGIAVAHPAEEYDPKVAGSHKFNVKGWWIVPPFTDEEKYGE